MRMEEKASMCWMISERKIEVPGNTTSVRSHRCSWRHVTRIAYFRQMNETLNNVEKLIKAWNGDDAVLLDRTIYWTEEIPNE